MLSLLKNKIRNKFLQTDYIHPYIIWCIDSFLSVISSFSIFLFFFRAGAICLKPFYFSGVRCQISLLYSSMVLSEEKYPAFPIFTSIFSAHAVLSS